MHGFTCGIGDLLLLSKGEKERRHKLRKADQLGDSVHARFAGVKDDDTGHNFTLNSSQLFVRSFSIAPAAS
jgi:hypothetical protein